MFLQIKTQPGKNAFFSCYMYSSWRKLSIKALEHWVKYNIVKWRLKAKRNRQKIKWEGHLPYAIQEMKISSLF